MKLTWFGGSTIRIQSGGTILVCDATAAPFGIDQVELVSGADLVLELNGSIIPPVDGEQWRPRALPTALNDSGLEAGVSVWRLGGGSVLIDAVGEAPLVLVTDGVPTLGRWCRDAIVVLFGSGQGMEAQGLALLKAGAPKLILLAGKEPDMDYAVGGLREHLDGTGLLALQAGLAIEA